MLRCTKDFRQYQHDYKAGDVIYVPANIESWLLDSFPAHFERIDAAPVEARDIKTPPADKAIKTPRGRK